MTDTRHFVLGLDAGNTKTVALAAHLDGRIAGSGRAGCGDIYTGGSPEVPLAEVQTALDAALAQAGLVPRNLAAAAFSMAGADWPEDFGLIRDWICARGFGTADCGPRLVVVNDALGALRAGSPDGCGVAVVCGTGAATGARAPGGKCWHASWWQQPQGAHELGLQTLRAVFRAELGLAPPTTLTARVLDFYQASSVEQVLHRRTARPGVHPPQPHPARLARVLLDEAAADDPTARSMVEAHGAALGDYALVAARKVGLESSAFHLVLSGGVLRHPSRLLAQALAARVLEAAPRAMPVASPFEPAVGAVLLALEAAGVAIAPGVLENLEASLPPAALFDTG
jgi:N-acetylglucosamine kinase-like BadF-type ATPase